LEVSHFTAVLKHHFTERMIEFILNDTQQTRFETTDAEMELDEIYFGLKSLSTFDLSLLVVVRKFQERSEDVNNEILFAAWYRFVDVHLKHLRTEPNTVIFQMKLSSLVDAGLIVEKKSEQENGKKVVRLELTFPYRFLKHYLEHVKQDDVLTNWLSHTMEI
jgi:hypothetical protein